MTKQIKIYLFIFGALLLTALFFYLSNQDSTLQLKTSGFSVDDVVRIQEIVFKKGENQLVLSKTPEGWLINQEFMANNRLIISFLRSLGNLRVKSPVSLGEQERILERIINEGVEVEVKKRWSTKKFRVWYQEDRPTYMVLGNSKSPFIMEVPGLLTEVGEFFRMEEAFWRENVIFSLNADQIKNVRVEYPSGVASGFEVNVKGINEFDLFSLPGEVKLKDFSDSLVFQYLTYFSFVPYQKLLTSVMEEKLNSLQNEIPFSRIELVGKSNQHFVLELFLIESETIKGEYDPDKLFGLINEGRDLVYVTFVSVDLLLRELDHFTNDLSFSEIGTH
jgi:hypothetical protein